mgnify:CR=1 FL=1
MDSGSPKFKRAAYDAALSSSEPVIREDPPLWEITLWPHRSLGRTGFRNTMILVAFGLLLPTLPLFFTTAGWTMVPFIGGAFLMMWLAFKLNYRHGRITEHLSLWSDIIAVERHELDGEIKRWKANPYWLRIKLIKEGGPVDNYLTLIGNDREIELGAFLSPEERLALKDEIESRINRLNINT